MDSLLQVLLLIMGAVAVIRFTMHLSVFGLIAVLSKRTVASEKSKTPRPKLPENASSQNLLYSVYAG